MTTTTTMLLEGLTVMKSFELPRGIIAEIVSGKPTDFERIGMHADAAIVVRAPDSDRSRVYALLPTTRQLQPGPNGDCWIDDDKGLARAYLITPKGARVSAYFNLY